MYFLRRNPDFKSISAFIRFYSFGRKCHYEVLNLRKNCSDKDIKEAFIQLSKEYHPDKNKTAKAQEKFVRIVEAYNILGKPSSRAQYDNMREIPTFTYPGPPHVYRQSKPNTARSQQYTNYYDTHAQSEQKQKTNNSYYGVTGLKKVPNYVIILLCFGIASIGLVVQLFVIRELYVDQQKLARQKSQYLAEELDKVRAAAKGNTNEMQTKILLEKIVTAANPTIATASLGQALANEKK